LDASLRPAAQKEKFNPRGTGAHWDFPERQVPHYRRERSTEHKFLTPVFGTICPPKGLSGVVRRYAYRLSEGRVAHWVLLMVADRLDVIESGLKALLRGRPDNPLTEAGLRAELWHHGLRTRARERRIDTKHHGLLLFAGAGLALAAGLYVLNRAPRAREPRLRLA
jgi:hypothetical protein